MKIGMLGTGDVGKALGRGFVALGHRALEGSLRRLGTDYVDLYWLHFWDGLTPVEEVMGTLDALAASAKGLGRTPAQVAIHWVTKRPGVSSTVIGATTRAQLEDDLAALEFDLPEEHARRLEEAGRPEEFFPYTFFRPEMRSFVMGARTSAEPRWFRGG